MRTRWAWLVAGWLGLVMASGCEEPPAGPPPAPPPLPAGKTVNAVFPPGKSYMPFQSESGDAVVVAKCRSVEEYAKNLRGNWEDHWYLVEWDVMIVEQGQWPTKVVAFVFDAPWPTPGSGIMLKMAPFPYVTGRVFAFSLKTTEAPPLIVAMEERSRLLPHGARVLPKLDFRTAESKAEYEAVMNAVRDYEAGQGIPAVGVSQMREETPSAYVVEHWTGFGKSPKAWAFRVAKSTYQVELLP